MFLKTKTGISMQLTQYLIVIVNLDPTIGNEIKKKRPCLIFSPDEMNRLLGTVTVCPITPSSKSYPTRVEFILKGNKNQNAIDQIRTIYKSRIIKTLHKLDADKIIEVKAVIRETFVDD